MPKNITASKHNPHEDLSIHIPRNAAQLLELCVDNFENARMFKSCNPNCSYTGISLPTKKKIKNKDVLDHHFSTSITNDDIAALNLEKHSFDCVLLNNLFHPLSDSHELSSLLHSLLKKTGMLIISADNQFYWPHIESKYKKANATEVQLTEFVTTLRKYSFSTDIRAFLSHYKCDLHNLVCKRTYRKTKTIENFLHRLAPIAKAQNINLGDIEKVLLSNHIIFSCTPQKSISQYFYFYGLSFGYQGHCTYPRMIHPMTGLLSMPGVRGKFKERASELPKDIPPHFKRIFLAQRPLMYPVDVGVSNIVSLMRNGYMIIVDFDDHPLLWDAYEKSDHFAFRACHAIQTATQPLADLLSQYNPEITVFPNQIDKIRPFTYKPKKKITIFCGAYNREEEWQHILPVLNKLIDEYGDQLFFDTVFDKGLYEGLNTSQKAYDYMLPPDKYNQHMRNADISLMPLLDNEFNRMKSDLKFIETASNSTIAVASPVVYESTVKDMETGVIFHNNDELYAKMNQLINEPRLREHIAKNAYKYVSEERILAYHLQARYDWYCSLVERKEELTQKLKERSPELKTYA